MKVMTIGKKTHQLNTATGMLICDRQWPITEEERATTQEALPSVVSCGRCHNTIVFRSDYEMERRCRSGQAIVSPGVAWVQSDEEMPGLYEFLYQDEEGKHEADTSQVDIS